jgi:hypothetical protein
MGYVEDHIFLMTSIFAGSVMLLLGVFLVAEVMSIPQFANTPGTAAIQQNFGYIDGLMLFGVVCFCIANVLLAYFLPSSPLFFVTYLVVAAVTFVFAPIYANAYALLAQTNVLAAAAQQLPYTALIMGHLPIISLVIATLVGLANYAKRPEQAAYAGLL